MCVVRAESQPRLPSDGSLKQLSKEQMAAKLRSVAEYKKNAKPATPTPPPPTSPEQTQPQAKDNALEALDVYAQQQAQDEAANFLAAQQQLQASKPPPPPPALPTAPPPQQEQQQQPSTEVYTRGGGGNSDQAASWLQTMSTENLAAELDASTLRPEEYTAKKEELQRQRGGSVERAKGVVTGTRRSRKFFEDEENYGLAQQQDDAEASISREKSDFVAQQMAEQVGKDVDDQEAEEEKEQREKDDASLHKPKVATWGVFPRPKNISEAFGGGRNLRPGQELETEDEAAARQQRVSAALTSYRKTLGLDIDPATESECESLFEQGDALFKAGRINAALEVFSAAAELVPLKSKIGGRVYLQKAICLDSLGRNDDAYTIYKKLEGHSGPGVSKAAKRFLFGFKAAKKLKVDTMYYGSGGVEAWQSYFDRINTGGWTEYKAREEESEEDRTNARQASLLAAAVVLVPLAFATAIVVVR